MRCTMIFFGLLLVTVVCTGANAAGTWAISPQHPCTGLTAGFARPLSDLAKLVGPHWRPAPGPFKGQGLVLLFVTACPDSAYAGKPTGPFGSAFILVPVKERTPSTSETHAIAVLRAAGRQGSPVMKLFHNHGIPVSNARISLTVHDAAGLTRAETIMDFTQGRLTLDAEMQPKTQAYKSLKTLAVRAEPAGILFSGPESSTRYAHGKATAHASGRTWLERYKLGTPLFVTLDTDFIWSFDFTQALHH